MAATPPVNTVTHLVSVEGIGDVGVDDIAADFLGRAGPMSPMKLQKLVYYAQAWHLVRYGHPLFPDGIEAWRQGPVVRHLYDQHRRQYLVSAWPSGSAGRVIGRAAETVSWVVQRYGGFAARELSELTHADLPWRQTRAGLDESARSSRSICPELMREYYGRHHMTVADAVVDVVASTRLEGVELPGDVLAELVEVANGRRSADDAVAALIASRRGRR
ncbi:Panacea domain-containing protein [Frankia sp. Cas3]|uniref:Panacea domain-containing protein n=1 Tax=Frankia sp. Cas3 TaxID=3073926 RepID=UPI002AD355A2|nr:type II toxin-antitoxin system antitoxin SocA domain-containing protein [Frankia sp. Cas3]